MVVPTSAAAAPLSLGRRPDGLRSRERSRERTAAKAMSDVDDKEASDVDRVQDDGSHNDVERISLSLKSLVPVAKPSTGADVAVPGGVVSSMSAVALANKAAESARKGTLLHEDDQSVSSSAIGLSVVPKVGGHFETRIPHVSPDVSDRATQRRLKDMEARVDYLINGELNVNDRAMPLQRQ